VEAPRLPGAEAPTSPRQDGPAAPGQASAFRRALDKQAVADDPDGALVPSGAHDLTAPLDLQAIRAALARASAGETTILPIMSTPTSTVIKYPGPPCAVEPSSPPSEPPGDGDSAARGNGGGGRRTPGRLPTAVWISAVLAALAGAALILVDQGHDGDPLAPTALPAKASHSAPAQPTSTPPPSPAAHSPSARPSTAPQPPPSRSATSHSASAPPSSEPSGTGAFVTLSQGSAGAAVVDVQRRLSDLGLLSASPDDSIYRDSQWTLWEIQQQRGPSPDTGGYYGQATDYAIMAFKRHYLDNDQGPVPPGSCDAATYSKLFSETASFTTN
jgi:hypothetical protein